MIRHMLPLLMSLSFAVATGSASVAQADDGPSIFKAQKCTKCHTAPGIKGGKKKDLTGVGKRHDKKTMKAFLLKETKIKDKKHKKKWKGPDAELDTLVDWLASLK